LVFHESEFVESLPTSKPLDQLTIDDLPNWLLKQGLPLALTAPQEVTAGDDADAWMEVCREASRAYRGKGEAVRDAA
jgi:hypothetical protein